MAKSIEGIENKSLAPEGIEDKAVAAPAGVRVVVAHPLPAGVVGKQEAGVGDEVTVDEYEAKSLVQQGLVRYA